ncbi:unnamed protein product, partial [Sphenostylis stenocarpa]
SQLIHSGRPLGLGLSPTCKNLEHSAKLVISGDRQPRYWDGSSPLDSRSGTPKVSPSHLAFGCRPPTLALLLVRDHPKLSLPSVPIMPTWS